MSVKRFSSASADPQVVHEWLKADGIVVIEGATTSSTIDTCLSEVGSLSSSQTYALAAKSPTFATNLLMHSLFFDLTKRILTDTCVIYYEKERTVSTAEPQVSTTAALKQEPGSSGWGLRRQDDCHHTKHPARRETDFGVAFAGTDITKENGAMRVVVGSNQWDDKRDPTPEDEVLVELKKGDAVLL